MPEIFLSKKDRLTLKQWKYKVEDKSIIAAYYQPMWNFLARCIPNDVIIYI
jgi:hypothetical protein